MFDIKSKNSWELIFLVKGGSKKKEILGTLVIMPVGL